MTLLVICLNMLRTVRREREVPKRKKKREEERLVKKETERKKREMETN